MKCVEVYKELYHQEPFDVAFCPYRISPLGAHIDHQYGKINAQTMRYFEQMQERITGFVKNHSHISEARFLELMMHTGELGWMWAPCWAASRRWPRA